MGQGGGGWVHLKGANSMAASGLSPWLEHRCSHLVTVQPRIPMLKVDFSVIM